MEIKKIASWHRLKKTVVFFMAVTSVFTVWADPLTGSTTEYSGSGKRFPNSIHIIRDDINGLLAKNEISTPYGLAALLSMQTGMTFMNTGDIGAETWFSIRGFGRDNSRVILMLLDGKPMNFASNHTIEMDDVPISIIESITIYPGPVPARYGGYQFVIDIKTIHNKDVAEASASIASRDTYHMSATMAKSGKFHYMANFDLDVTKGDSYKTLSGVLSDFTYGNRHGHTMLPTLKAGYEVTKDIDITLQGNFVEYKKLYDSEMLNDTWRQKKEHVNSRPILCLLNPDAVPARIII